MAWKICTLILSAGVAMTGSHAFATDLATWSQGARGNFQNGACITIPGTPGVPKKCAPDTKVSYPCGSFSNPFKTCDRTIKGPCTPAIPSTPKHVECANADLGIVDVHADGAIATTGSSIRVQNTVHAQIFGASTHFTWTCDVKADARYKACVDLMNPVNVSVDHIPKDNVKYSADTMSCRITTPGVSIKTKPIAATVCSFVDVNNVKSAKPTGVVGAQVHAQVGFGKQSVAGQTIDLGSKDWAKTLFRVNY